MRSERRLTYTCSVCEKTYESDWSDEDARAELKENFDLGDTTDCAVICDDCYKRMFGGPIYGTA